MLTKEEFLDIIKEELQLYFAEEKLSKPQIIKRDELAKKLLSDPDFKKKYGDKAQDVAYGTATNQVKEEIKKQKE